MSYFTTLLHVLHLSETFFPGWLGSGLSSPPSTKLESLDPACSLSRKMTFLSHFLSWLTDFWSHPEITSSSLENPHVDFPAPRGTGGLLSEWKTGVGGEVVHFPGWEANLSADDIEPPWWFISATWNGSFDWQPPTFPRFSPFHVGQMKQ